MYSVDSEVGQLHDVVLHRPGAEFSRLSPSNADELLFDDALWLQRAQEEHDHFARVLASRGVNVHLFDSLFRETLAIASARQYVLDRTFDGLVIGSVAAEALRSCFDAMDVGTLAEYLVGGITKREVCERLADPGTVAFGALGLDAFVIEPLLNHLYARDASSWIYGGVVVNQMGQSARRRESLHYEAIYRWHPMFTGDRWAFWSIDGEGSSGTTEGGDLLVLGDGSLLVGLSGRTSALGVEGLARRLFAGGQVERIVALLLPANHRQVHLDSVFTMANSQTFVEFTGLGGLSSFSVWPSQSADDLRVIENPPDKMDAVIADAMGVNDIRVLRANHDAVAAEREQWDDGCNLLAIAPGVVIAYERNVTTNDFLRRNGIEVLEVPGGELGRGGGGPRCMSCPIRRS